jgi:hypothetical protein
VGGMAVVEVEHEHDDSNKKALLGCGHQESLGCHPPDYSGVRQKIGIEWNILRIALTLVRVGIARS